MRVQDTLTFALDNFEGPLPLLVHLIQKSEIGVDEIPLHRLGAQFIELLEKACASIDQGAEFIGAISFLMYLKSRALLPRDDQPLDEGWEDPQFDVIHYLIEYVRFKDAAKGLSELEKRQSSLHRRGIEPRIENRKHLGIEHLSLDDIAVLFKQLSHKIPKSVGLIEEEDWKVSDKVEWLLNACKPGVKIPFAELFIKMSSRGELIVTFLALLELMKLGQLVVLRDNLTRAIFVCKEEG